MILVYRYDSSCAPSGGRWLMSVCWKLVIIMHRVQTDQLEPPCLSVRDTGSETQTPSRQTPDMDSSVELVVEARRYILTLHYLDIT